MNLTCPRCGAASTQHAKSIDVDGSMVIRRYKCGMGHKFTTREVPYPCVNHVEYAKYRSQIRLRARAEKRRHYIMRHPEMTDKALGGRLHISPERVRQIRSDIRGTLGKSRLSPPLRPEDE